MPTILRINGYRFFFTLMIIPLLIFMLKRQECTAKFNLNPIELVKSKRFNAREINKIRRLVFYNVQLFKTKWDEYFNNN